MTTTPGYGRRRNLQFLMTAVAFAAAALFAMSTPASAKDHGNHNGNHGHGRSHQSQKVVYRTVPRSIAVAERSMFQPYYSGRVYYAPHHHYHARYRLPVWSGGAVVYRPYAYCGDQLFVTGAVNLPQLAIAFNFGSPGGLYLNGWYPAPPPVAYVQPYEVYQEPRGHDCDHGWDH